MKTFGRRWLAVATAALWVTAAGAQTTGRRVALTLDDGPVVNEFKDLTHFQEVTNGLIGALVAEKVPSTIFLIESQLNVQGQRDGRAAVLDQWLDAGFDLANHTYTHPNPGQVPLWHYQDEIVRGEVITRKLMEAKGKKLTWFRYPYLASGPDPDYHERLETFLKIRGYRVAPVTVDYADFSFTGVYMRYVREGNMEMAEKIKQAYLNQIDVGFEFAERKSKELFGYEPPQILLLHCNDLNARTLRESIAVMRKRGYTFVTLDEAMDDPIYKKPDLFTGPGGSWLSRMAIQMGKPIPPGEGVRFPEWIRALNPPRAGARGGARGGQQQQQQPGNPPNRQQ